VATYCPGNKGSRYAKPVVEKNGELLRLDIDKYGPDIFTDYIIDYIKRKKDEPFFIYYPMVLVHDPFVPTPDSEQWADQEARLKGNKAYFSDMMSYTDKIVGQIINTLKENKIYDNTILIFTGDNGTSRAISSETTWGQVKGFKGNTTDAGTRVPLIVSWPGINNGNSVFEGLVDFADFMPTFAEIAGMEVESDGISLMPVLKGDKTPLKDKVFIHYDPKWNKNVSQYRNQFARTLEYKLYQDGKFYYLPDDVLEESPIMDSLLTGEQRAIKDMLQKAINEAPIWE